MNKKRNGFLIIENLIALCIVALISSLVVSIFSTSIFCINKFKTKQQMINIAKSEINKINKDDSYIDKLYSNLNEENKVIDGYTVESGVDSMIDYYNCYKIKVLVKSEIDEIKIESYMVRE
ncbi:MAG: hypothetical protein ACRC1Y_01980 [Paraclostridium sp.]